MNKTIQNIATVLCFATIAGAQSPEFEKDVAPILNKYCVGCHSVDDPEADLVLESVDGLIKGGESGPAINRNDFSQSLLISRITAPEDRMPPEDEPQPSKAEIAKLVAWIAAGANSSASTTAPTTVNFHKVKPSTGAKPITAIAYRRGEQIVLLDDRKLSGVDLVSPQGLLVPSLGGDAAPFTFFLSNTAKQITYGNLGTEFKVPGELRLSAKYSGAEPETDLKITVAVGPTPVAANYRFGEGVAIAKFGVVEVYDETSSDALFKRKTPGKVHALRFSRDGKRLIAASGVAGLKGEAVLWDAIDGEELQRFQGHRDAMYAVAMSDNDEFVATGSYDRQVMIWDAATGEQLRTLKGHNGAIYDLDFSPDAKVLVTASADSTVKVWNVQTGERLDTLGQPLKEQYTVDISPDGRHVIAAGEDNRIRMWRLVSIEAPEINPILESRFAHDGAIERVRFSNNGKYVVSSSTDGTIKVWGAEKLELLNAYNKPKGSSAALAISRDDNRISIGTLDGTLKAYPLRASEQSKDAPKRTDIATTTFSQNALTEYEETEPNNGPKTAQPINVPATVRGRIHSVVSATPSSDADVFRFKAKAGEKWIVEVEAAREKSPLDSHVAVLTDDGQTVPRVQLQATRDSYFTFRGKDSNGTGDFRLHNWEEMQLNQYLYSAGEVVKLYHYPRGPDSGFNVYPNFGNRRGYFDTTPLAHALHEPAYIVEPHPPGVQLPPNGLPVFTLNYENDDDSQRRLGKDSRLTFVAPKDGNYCVVLRDVRGSQGEDFSYALSVRAPVPDFKGKLLNSNLKVAPGSGKKFGLEVERIDGFDGPIDVEINNLPAGFSVPGPLQFEAQHDRLSATLLAEQDVTTPTEKEWERTRIVLSAKLGDQTVRREVGSLGTIELADAAKLLVRLVPNHEPAKGAAKYPVIELKPGESTTATIKITRIDHDGRVGFGNESGAVNAPHGVYVDNIGLNGVLIVEGQDERQFFITAEPWVKPMERVIFVETNDADKPTSNPVLLRILSP